MTETKKEALELAQTLQALGFGGTCDIAAAMLRSQAAEIEYLKAYSESQTDSFDMMMIELKKLREAQQVAVPQDAITVNLMRLAGLDKHKARECAEIVSLMLTAAPQPPQTDAPQSDHK